ncbi:MAG: diaminopimelate epimerase [Myxococcota bacterium]
MKLWRAHGLGNDYLVAESGPALTPSLARRICDRHTGVGSDGVLEPADPGTQDYGVRIWNPDGSTAEKSGNGLRIFARWLEQEQNAGTQFSVWTGSEAVQCDVGPEQITIEMGQARLKPAEVPVLADGPVIHERWTVGPDAVHLTVVGMGNPHAVVLVDPNQDLDALPWRRWGAAIESDPRFPNRTNVQVCRCLPQGGLEIRIWERGAGPTQASGSSACASTVAAVVNHRLKPGRHAVHMPGGTLFVTVDPELQVRLEGPVQAVGRIEVDPAWLAAG